MKSKKNKAKLVYNDKALICDISEKFYSNYRTINEFATMCIENLLGSIDMNDDKMPVKLFEKIVSGGITEMDKQYMESHQRYSKKVIRLFNTKFDTKVDSRTFHFDSYNITEKEEKLGVVIHIRAYDINWKQPESSVNLSIFDTFNKIYNDK